MPDPKASKGPGKLVSIQEVTPGSTTQQNSRTSSQVASQVNQAKPTGKLVSIEETTPGQYTEQSNLWTGYDESQIDKLPTYNDDEKQWLKNSRSMIGSKMSNGEIYTEQMWDEDKSVFTREHKGYGAIDPLTPGSQPISKSYYFDPKDGRPKPIKLGEKAPVDSKVESVWGNYLSSNDDNLITIGAKAFVNSAMDILKVPPLIWDFAQGLATGEESKVANFAYNVFDRFKFDQKETGSVVDTSKINSFSDLLKSDTYNKDPEAWVNMTGSILGYVAQFMMGGYASGARTAGTNAAKYGMQASQAVEQGLLTEAKAFSKMASKASTSAAIRQQVNSIAINMGNGLDAAERAGLKGRDKYAMASVIATATGLLEGFGGLEARIGTGQVRKVASEITDETIKKFAKSGEAITAEALDGAFKHALKKGVQIIPTFIKEGIKEGTEEALQTYTQEGLEQIYDHLRRDKFGANVKSPKVLGEALEGFIGGALMGGFGNARMTDSQKDQADNIFQAIKTGSEGQLIDQMHNLVINGKMTPADVEAAKKKIADYKQYIEKIKDVPGTDEDRARAAQIVAEDNNLVKSIDALKAENVESKDITANAKIKAFEQRRTELLNELTSLYSGKNESKEETKKEPETRKEKKGTESKSQKTPEGDEVVQGVPDTNTTEGDQTSEAGQEDVAKTEKIKEFAKKIFAGEKVRGLENHEFQIENEKAINEEIEKLKTESSKKPESVTEPPAEPPVEQADKKTAEPPVEVTSKPDEPTKSLEEYQDEEFKALPVSKQKEALVQHFKSGKKKVNGKVVMTGPTTVGVQIGNKTLRIASTVGATKKSSIGEENLGESVTLRHVPKEQWNPKGEIKNKLTGEPYGDKIEVIQKGKVVGHIQETDYTKEQKTAAIKKELEGKNVLGVIPNKDLSPKHAAVEERFTKYLNENIEEAERRYNEKFGAEINADNAKELSTEYEKNPSEYAEAVHNASSAFADYLYNKRIAEKAKKDESKTVLITAGGGGVGKTSGLEKLQKLKDLKSAASIIFDGTGRVVSSTDQKIQKALKSGRRVVIVWTYRDVVDSFRNGVIPRAIEKGRAVPYYIIPGAHIGSYNAMKELMKKYEGNSKVQFRLVDNSGKKGEAKYMTVENFNQLKYLSEKEYENQLLKITEDEYQKGNIPEQIYKGLKGSRESEVVDSAGDKQAPGQQSSGSDSGRVSGKLEQQVKTKAGKKLKKLAIQVRKLADDIDKQNVLPSSFLPIPPFAVKQALRVLANALEGAASVAEAVDKLMDWLKKNYRSEWNKLTDEARENAKKETIERLEKLDEQSGIDAIKEEKILGSLADLADAIGLDRSNMEDMSKALIGETGRTHESSKAKVKKYYLKLAKHPAFKNQEDIESLLRKVFHHSKAFTSDIKGNTKKLKESNNQQYKALGEHLSTLADGEIISLGIVFRSMKPKPYFFTYINKGKTSLEASNVDFEGVLNRQAEATLSALSEDEFNKKRANYIQERNKIKPEERYVADLAFLEDVTGVPSKHWEKYMYAESFKKSTYNREIKSVPTPRYMKNLDGTLKTFEEWARNSGNGSNVLWKNLIVNKTAQEFTDNILHAKGKGMGSAINTIAENTSYEEQIKNIVSKFKNPVYDLKSSYENDTHFSWMLENIGNKEYQESKRYKKNNFVQDHKNKPAQFISISGIKSKLNGNSSNVGSMHEDDVSLTLVTAFKEGQDSYYQAAGQFSDKDKLELVRVRKYSDIQKLKKDYKKRLKSQGFSDKYINEQIKQLDRSVNKWQSLYFTSGKNNEADAEAFVWNYAYNFNELNEFFNGDISQYGNKERTPLSITKELFKRNGSMSSPGMPGDMEVEGGIGKTHNAVVIKLPNAEFTHPNGTKISTKQADGQSWISRDFSNKIKVSTGKAFDYNSIIKAITSITNPEGNRFLDKSGTDTIDEIAEMFPNSFWAQLDKFIKEQKKKGIIIDKITTVDGAKKFTGHEAYVLGEEFNPEKHLITIDNNHLRFQQDYVNSGKLKPGTVPIQQYKNELISDKAKDIAVQRNKALEFQLFDYLDKTFGKDPDVIREKILDILDIDAILELEEKENAGIDTTNDEFISEDRRTIAKMLKWEGPDGERVDFNSPWLRNWLSTFFSNRITKEALGRLTNSARYKTSAYIESKDFKLDEARIVDGKVLLPTIAISELSGARGPEKFKSHKEAIEHINANPTEYTDMFDSNGKILEHEIVDNTIPGEILKITRIPADNMHSHPVVRVKYLLPAAAKNIIISPHGIVNIAGEDMDGDNRTVEGIFKKKDKETGKLIYQTSGPKGVANKVFMDSVSWYYDPANQEALYKAIDTKTGFKSILEKLEGRMDLYPDTPDSFVQMRKMYQVGLKVVGIAANIQSTMDFLRKHDVGLKNDLWFPKLKLDDKGGLVFVDNNAGKYFTTKKTTKDLWANLLNLAVDNGNELAIETLGLNEITANWYGLLVGRGYSVETLAAFFNHPFVKHVVHEMRSTQSVNNKEEQSAVLRRMAENFHSDLTGGFDEKSFYREWYNKTSIILKESDFNNTSEGNFNILKKLNELTAINFELSHVQTVIKAGDELPKTIAEHYRLRDSIEKVMENIDGNKLNYIDTTNLKDSQFLKAAKIAWNAGETVWNTFSSMRNMTAKSIQRVFEVNNTNPKKIRTFKGQVISRLTKDEMTILAKAVDAITLQESRNLEQSFEDLSAGLIEALEAQKQKKSDYSPLLDMLEILEEDGTKKVALRYDLQRAQISDEQLVQAQELLEDLYFSEGKANKALGKALVDYLVFQYNMSPSTFSGSYANLLSPKVHWAISVDLYDTLQAWQDGTPKRTEDEYVSSIMKMHPELDFKNEVITEGKKKEKFTKNYVYKFDEKQKPQQQKISTSTQDTEKIRQEKLARLQKALPGLKVVADYSLQSLGEVSEDGKTMRYNPAYNYSDTVIHEYGHALIDVLGGHTNALIRNGIKQLKGTKLWDEVAKANPELTQEMLEKEVLATAIGREGASIFKEQSAKSAFRNWLDVFFMKVKRMLGIEKNIARSLASQLLAGTKITDQTQAGGGVQKQKLNHSQIAENIRKATDKNVKFEEESHTYSVFDQKLQSVSERIKSLPGYSYTGPDKMEYEDSSEMGKAIHKMAEDIVNEVDKDFADKWSEVKHLMNQETFEYLQEKLGDFIANLKKQGTVLSEIKLAHTESGLAGTSDIVLVKNDGTVDIYDFKTSTASTSSSNYTEPIREGKKSKKQKHGLQIATYAKILELGDESIGLPQHKIDNLTIVPIKLEVKDKKITSAKMENNINFGYHLYEQEVLAKTVHTEPSLENTEIPDNINDWKQYAEAAGYKMNVHDANLEKALKTLGDDNASEEMKIKAGIDSKALQEKESFYVNQFAEYKKDIKAIRTLKKNYGDISGMSLNELIELLNRIRSYDDVAGHPFFIEVAEQIGRQSQKLQVERLQELKRKNPELYKDFDFEKINEGDIAKGDWMFKALSDFDQSQTGLQFLSGKVSENNLKIEQEKAAFRKVMHPLFMAIVKEQGGVADKVRDFFNPLQDNSKYQKNLTKKDANGNLVFKKWNDPSLTKAESAFLKEMLKFKMSMKQVHIDNGGTFEQQAVIKVDQSISESIKQFGWVGGYIHKLGSNYMIRNVRLKFQNPKTGKIEPMYFGEIKDALASYAQGGFLTKVKAAYWMTIYSNRAKKLIGSEKNLDEYGDPISTEGVSEYTLNKSGNITSKFGRRRAEDRPFSKDFYGAFVNYMDEMIYVKNKKELVPIVEGLERLALMEDKKNLQNFLSNWKKANIFHEELKSDIPYNATRIMKVLRWWSHVMVMRFTLSGPIFNAIAGKYNQIYTQDMKYALRGELRMAKNKKKFWNIVSKYNFTPFEPEAKPNKNFWNLLDAISIWGYKWGETMIHATSGVAQIEDEVYDKWFDNDGNILDSNGKYNGQQGANEEEIKERNEEFDRLARKYKKKGYDIQGKYTDDEKRGYTHYELGRFVGQYKTWLPDVILTHIKTKAVNRDGEIVEGTLNTLWRALFGELRKDLVSGKIFKGDSVEARNMRSNVKELVAAASLLVLYLGASDDDDDKQHALWTERMIGNVLSAYDISGVTSAITPASAAVIKKLITLVEDGLWATEKGKGKYHDKGDLKFYGNVYDVLPYRRMIQTPVDVIETFED